MGLKTPKHNNSTMELKPVVHYTRLQKWSRHDQLRRTGLVCVCHEGSNIGKHSQFSSCSDRQFTQKRGQQTRVEGSNKHVRYATFPAVVDLEAKLKYKDCTKFADSVRGRKSCSDTWIKWGLTHCESAMFVIMLRMTNMLMQCHVGRNSSQNPSP